MSVKDESTTEEQTTAAADRGDEVDEVDGDKPLGPAGEKALAAEKDKRKAATERARKAEAERDALKAAAEQAKQGGDEQPDAEKIREQAKAEARAEVLRDRALDKVEAKAAKLFADPEDARALLASAVDDFVDGGKVDVEAIEEALADLLKRKPHLAAATARRFQGGADGGARNGSKPQLTRADVQKLAREGKHGEIEKARSEGRIDYGKS